MQISEEMQATIERLSGLPGYICHGLVNYQKGVSTLNEDSSPMDEANFSPQQCTAIITTLKNSLANLDGGQPDKLIVEAEKMTMMIYPANDTYFCGVGLQPGTPIDEVAKGLEELRGAFRKQLG